MLVGIAIALFVPVLVAWVVSLANVDRPDDSIEAWDNGLIISSTIHTS